jgi:hypothetical protein
LRECLDVRRGQIRRFTVHPRDLGDQRDCSHQMGLRAWSRLANWATTRYGVEMLDMRSELFLKQLRGARPVTTLTLEQQYKPYKGPESYQVEDAAFFFGRNEAADQIVAHVLSAHISLLHAQSGAGKTSLLNALVIPQLEERGWTPVRILPQNDPVRATRVACLQYVVPPPEAEAIALRRALDGLFGATDDPTLDELLARYDDPGILPGTRPPQALPDRAGAAR